MAIESGNPVLPVSSADSFHSEWLYFEPATSWDSALYWLPAMGVPARHYQPMAEALAKRGVAVALHEWRGIGSSDQRAGRHSNWGYRELLQDDLPAALAVLQKRWPNASLVIGGHSLGGQIAAQYAGLHPAGFRGLALVASGSPYWRRYRYGRLLYLCYLAAPALSRMVGYLPGRRIGFGGNEARGLIADWAASGRTGIYTARGMGEDIDAAMRSLRLPVLGLRLADDWLAPAASLEWLLDKMPHAGRTLDVLGDEDMDGVFADHFAWMKMPAPVVGRLLRWFEAHISGHA